jgi:hypothetical protein
LTRFFIELQRGKKSVKNETDVQFMLNVNLLC